MTVRNCSRVIPVILGLLSAQHARAQEDPASTGPFVNITVEDYSAPSITLGAISNVEVLAQVHYPTTLGTGKYPLVLFLHGMHGVCYVVATGEQVEEENKWPCAPVTEAAVTSYKGYDYLAQVLASHGMIVASISANAINARPNTEGISERPMLIQHHLNKWQTFATTGGAPFGTRFVGRVDLQRIGMMGHSRGGHAVLNHAVNTPPAGLRAVLAIAPTGSGTSVPWNDVPLAILLGYCDGDQDDLQGVGYFDRARYSVAAGVSPKYTILGRGANHDYFNRFWTPPVPLSDDDWIHDDDPQCGTASADRLTATEQRDFGRAYMAAFFRKHLLGAAQFDAILNGDALPPPSAQTTDVFLGYMPGADDRKDLNRISSVSGATQNTLGGAVIFSGLTATPCQKDTTTCITTSRATHFGDLSAVRIEWNSLLGTYTNELPLFKRDVSNFATLQFRVAVDFTDPDNPPEQPQDFDIRLRDAVGRASSIRASDYSDALYYPPGATGLSTNNKKAAVMNTLRVPLNAFLNVDLTNLLAVDFVFSRTPKGRILASDIAFAEEGTTAAEKWVISDGLL